MSYLVITKASWYCKIFFALLWPLLAFEGPLVSPHEICPVLCQDQVHVNVLKINIVIFYNSHGKRGLENVYFVFCQACIYPIMLADDRGQSQFITQMWRNQLWKKARTRQKNLTEIDHRVNELFIIPWHCPAANVTITCLQIQAFFIV